LALGTRLGVSEDLEYEDMDPDQPEATAHAVYGWLTWMQGDLIDTVLGE